MHPLDDARKRRVPWLEVARLVQQLERDGASWDTAEAPVRYAERVSGYSANQLRRMLAGLRFLEELAQEDRAVAAWLGTPRFSIAEMLGKLWRKDRRTTLQLLRNEPPLRYADLYALFHNLDTKGASSVSAAKQAGRQFRDGWLSNLKKDPGKFAPFGPGTYSVIQPRALHPYCKPTLLLRAENASSVTRWAGLDFIDKPIWDNDAMWRRVMLIATESTFLDLWCIFVADNSDVPDAQNPFERTKSMVHDLKLWNVTVAPVSGEITRGPRYLDLGEELPTRVDRRQDWKPPTLSRTLLRYEITSSL